MREQGHSILQRLSCVQRTHVRTRVRTGMLLLQHARECVHVYTRAGGEGACF